MAENAKALSEMTDAELDEIALAYKVEEQAYLADVRARKVAVRDEIMSRARRSYASQRLRGLGIEPTEALIEEVIKSGTKLPDSGVVATPATGRHTMEAN